MQSIIALGKKIYNWDNLRERHRMLVFVIRAYLHHEQMKTLASFFCETGQKQQLACMNPYFYEQVTRAFFYKKSSFREREKLIEEHVDFLVQKMKPEILEQIYNKKDVIVWQTEYEEKILKLELFFEPGQRKEGLLAVMLKLEDRPLYQIMFWIARDRQGDWSMWIGAMQGPNMENARDVVKKLTKQCHSYRTKNLILYAAQGIARALHLQHIYAVTNEGYYANNHVRRDRKLKTSFSDFWKEAGGEATPDERFYEIPLTEHRKTMEEVPTRKRAVYRKRFALLDEIDASIAAKMESLMR